MYNEIMRILYKNNKQKKIYNREMKKMNIKQQRKVDLVLINWMNEDITYLPTLQEAELFRNYVLEYIEISGKDDLQQNVIPQLFNLYFIDITKEILNDIA